MDRTVLSDKCELYRLLLHPNIENGQESIEKALALVTRIVGARSAYIELRNSQGEECWSGHHCSPQDLEKIRSRISNTIITEALATGETIVTASAILDDRFNCAGSVISGQIESVLCSPIECDGLKGVIYLQGELSGLCDSESIDEAEFFTQNIQPLLKRLKYNVTKISPEDDLREMYDLTGVIGESRAYCKILNEAMAIASLDVTLLLTGETGTGKSYLAKVIHNNSSRKSGPFIHINCANIPGQLFESELFGASKGAYSGAAVDVPGKVMAADGGTLFLDEISEMPVQAQAKLLQFLEEGCFYPLGSTTQIKPDVRIIVASNVDFEKCLEAGAFRKDLYYRIAGFPLPVPALRERLEDLPELVDFHLKSFIAQFKYENFYISAASMKSLQSFEWPGNIRELQNRLQQALVRAKIEGSLELQVSDLLGEAEIPAPLGPVTFSNEKDKWERIFIAEQLANNAWNITRTAAVLEMSRSHLNRLIKEYDLQKPK